MKYLFDVFTRLMCIQHSQAPGNISMVSNVGTTHTQDLNKARLLRNVAFLHQSLFTLLRRGEGKDNRYSFKHYRDFVPLPFA